MKFFQFQRRPVPGRGTTACLHFLLFAHCFGGALSLAGAQDQPKIMFNRDIRPILSDNCFPCHGFDGNKRKADLRLDTAEGIVAVRKGRQAIKPGDLQGSELWRRVNARSAEEKMPPPESAKELKPEQLGLLRRWIEEGGKYEKHWAFEAPIAHPAPVISQTNGVRNEIDRFILAELQRRNLNPSPEADRETLIRRATLELTGLPPTIAEIDAFVSDQRPDAYELTIARLLESPRYGEHMARSWLDVVRYADTHGLHFDNERGIWAYRDWVVQAFNRNYPFDQFTIWQIGGDLLPNATREQLIASGYNRCNMSTSEGGAIDEEFQVRYAVDRVETTATAWLGLTMGCAVCHDHKLDPITQKEFYQVFSIFNNIDEKAMDGNALLPPPIVQLPTPEQEKALNEFLAKGTSLESKLKDEVAKVSYTDPATVTNRTKPEPREKVWVEDSFPDGAEVTVDGGQEQQKWLAATDGPVFSGERALKRVAKGLQQVFYKKPSEPMRIGRSAKLFVSIYIDPQDPPKAIMLQYHTDEWRHRANWGDPDVIPWGKDNKQRTQIGSLPETGKWVRLEFDAAQVGLQLGARVIGVAFTQVDGTVFWDKAGVSSVEDPAEDPELSLAAWLKTERQLGDKSAAPKEIQELLKKEEAKLAEAEREQLKQHFLKEVYAEAQSPLLGIRKEMKENREKREALEKDIPGTMISRELAKPRPAWVLLRGEYDKHGEEVGPGVPAVLPPLPPAEVTNRLTFARWLVSARNPMTARVTVNRLWQQFFGTGLVKSAEDFGTKAEWPSHPGLLDWLATEFVASGWDVKHMVTLIMTSATYRQDSKVSAQLAQIDPENRWLARGPRLRLDAEVLRDNALYLAGLLNLQMGGRGVRIYQPPGIWEAVGYTTSNTAKYTQDHGDALYRRSLYIFWKRTAPHPAMTTFDVPSREQCRARRERTNTPLQALVTLNDIQYFEAARHLAHRMLKEGGAQDADRLRYGFRLATARAPREQETKIMADTLEAIRARYVANSESAKAAISVGESPVPSDFPPTELGAYTILANLLLNLDEVVTKN